jgi:hypothetical protein
MPRRCLTETHNHEVAKCDSLTIVPVNHVRAHNWDCVRRVESGPRCKQVAQGIDASAHKRGRRIRALDYHHSTLQIYTLGTTLS